MLKTIRKDEFRLMKSILKEYYEHFTDINKNPESLISRVFGLHKIVFQKKKRKDQSKIYFCIINNVFCTKLKIDYRFDLKGSLQGRRTGEIEDMTVALKELDFRERYPKFKIKPAHKKSLMEIVKKDVEFLAKCELLDYSFLVGVHERDKHPVDKDSMALSSFGGDCISATESDFESQSRFGGLSK